MPRKIADAGAQLQRVLTFRESLVTSKTVLFKEFDSVEAWEKMLRAYLLRHVLDLARSSSNAPEGPSEPSPVVPSSAPSEPPNTVAPAAGEQIATLARSLAPAFASGDLDAVITSLNDADDTAFLAVRALLLSMALVAASRTSASLMPTHELNTLYRYRERLRATDDELYLVFGTLLADQSDVSPGWFWLRDLSARQTVVRLLRVILYAENSSARATSFSVLRDAKVPIFERFRQSFLTETLPTLPTEVHAEAWAYLVDVATSEDIKILGDARSTWLESRVAWLRAWVDAGRVLDQFLPNSPDPQFFTEPMKRFITDSIPQLSEASLSTLSESTLTDLSEQAVEEMARRATGPTGSRPRLRRRRFGLESLLAFRSPAFGEGAERQETDDERYERLSRQSNEELQLTLDWYSGDGRVSYQLLAERGEIPRETIRADVDTAFQRVHEASDQLVEKEYGQTAAAKVKHEWADLNDFIGRQFTEKAIAALAVDPTPEDVPVARKLLNNDVARISALEIIAAHGDASDVDRLLEIARVSFGDDRTTALKAIRRWAAEKLATAKVLIAAEGRDMRRAGLALVHDLDDSDALPVLEELMSHEDEEVRLIAVALLRLRVNTERLGELLRAYILKGTYYYNVVAWIDRLIFAPEPMSGYYMARIDQKLNEVIS